MPYMIQATGSSFALSLSLYTMRFIVNGLYAIKCRHTLNITYRFDELFSLLEAQLLTSSKIIKERKKVLQELVK